MCSGWMRIDDAESSCTGVQHARMVTRAARIATSKATSRIAPLAADSRQRRRRAHQNHDTQKATFHSILSSDTMDSKLELSLHLEKKQLDWLETMAKKYNLPSAGKALRICIVYTKQANDDASIFAKVQSIIDDSDALVATHQSIDDAHDKYLQALVVKFGLGSKDKAARLILDYVMTSGDETTIFEIKRCRHGETCKYC